MDINEILKHDEQFRYMMQPRKDVLLRPTLITQRTKNI